MAVSLGIYPIDVTMKFYDTGLNKPPTVTNPTTQSDIIEADKTKIEWKSQPDKRELKITGVTFFKTSAKTEAYTPPFFEDAGSNNRRLNWVVKFKKYTMPETTLWYTLHYKDKHHSGLKWDPSLQIKPRTG